MKVERIEADSIACGRNVLSINDFSEENFIEFENQYRRDFNPFYVSCKIPIENIAFIHQLEKFGFNFVEFQIKSIIKFKKQYPTESYPYAFELVDSEEKLAPVLEIAQITFEHDRFRVDPLVNKTMAGERYKQYVIKSYRSSEEAVYRLFNPDNNETMAFKTHKYLGNEEVLFLLGGVLPKYKKTGIGVLNSYFEFNRLIQKGVKRGYTHISGANYPVFNIEIGRMGFRVVATYAVMRKIYNSI